MLRYVRERCGDARAQACFYVAVICFACWLRWDGVAGGFLADDYAQLGMLDGSYPLKRQPWNLFTFSNGEVAEGKRLMDVGFYPWWADPTVRISMFRPLASLMIAADFSLFGNNELAYHLHSLFWWLVLLIFVAWLFRLWLSPAVAAVAFLLFSCSNAHGLVLAWICNRSAIIASLLSLLSLVAYVRSRESYSRARRLTAFALLVGALGFGEYALCGIAYFIAYELARSTDSAMRRTIELSPFVGAALIYLLVRNVLGLSMHRSGVYVDAVSEPLVFLRAVAHRLPVFLADLLFALRSDFWTFGAPGVGIELSRDTVVASWFANPAAWRVLQHSLGIIACVVVFALARTQGRDWNSRNVRWLLVGAVLSLIPVCGSFPSSRLTLAASVGVSPLLATFVVHYFARARLVAAILLCYLVVLPCVQQREEAQGFGYATRRIRDDILSLNVNDDAFKSQDVVVLGALEGGLSMYLPLTRHRYGESAPRSCWVLSFVPASYSLERTAGNAFRVRFHGTNTVGTSVTEQLLRRPDQPFVVGQAKQIGRMRVTVLELLHDRPKMLSFEFDRELEDPSLLFLFPAANGYQLFRIPRVGGSVVVPTAVVSTLADELVVDR